MPRVKTRKSTTSTKQTKSTKGGEKRPVVYKEVSVELCLGKDALTAEKAQKLMGWEVETDKNRFGTRFLIKDLDSQKVRCTNNVTNRPLYMNNVNNLIQEIVRGHWQFNGEPIIIGKTGLVLNGQHQMVALILAHQRYEKNKEKFKNSDGLVSSPPKIDKAVIYGVEESDGVVNTMDTCKPRSLADVIYRSEFFKDMKGSDRRIASRSANHAVRLLWSRTGVGLDAFAPRRTHSEAIDFLKRHPRLLECVKHVMVEEDGKNRRLSKYLSNSGSAIGYMAALMYLMAASDCNPDAYFDANLPNEEMITLDRWEDASDFVVRLASGDVGLKPVRLALGRMLNNDGGSKQEREALIVKAWLAQVANGKVTADDLELEYHTDEDGIRTLVEHPVVGGIDYDGDIPTPEEIEKRKARTTTGKKAQSMRKSVVSQKGSKAGEDWTKGDTAWVWWGDDDDEDEPAEFGTITREAVTSDYGDTMVLITTPSGEYEAPVEALTMDYPTVDPMLALDDGS